LEYNYQRMETNSDSPAIIQKDDTNLLKVSQSAPKTQQVQPVDLAPPSCKKNDIAADTNHESDGDERVNTTHPYVVQLIERSGLSRFEKRTIFLGWFGVGLGFLSLLAACAAAFYIYGQFTEMRMQTKILSDSSSDAACATAKQLALMQGQLTQQQDAFKVTERARVVLKYEQAGKVVNESQTIFSLKNSGLTSARNLRFGHRIVGILDNKWTRETPGKDFLKHWSWFAPRVLDPSNEYPIPPPIQLWQTRTLHGGQLLDWDYIGRVEYDDAFGLHHWFTFCYIRREDGTIGACPYGNEEDQNTNYSPPPPVSPCRAP